MSYSRWSDDSNWYVWWQSPEGHDELAFWLCLPGKGAQEDIVEFSYRYILQRPETALAELIKKTGCTGRDITLARGYMDEFVLDVQKEN